MTTTMKTCGSRARGGRRCWCRRTASAAAAPAATTGAATQINAGGARLNGTVDPNSEPTGVYFEYGLTNRYGSRTADAAAGAGTRAARR